MAGQSQSVFLKTISMVTDNQLTNLDDSLAALEHLGGKISLIALNAALERARSHELPPELQSKANDFLLLVEEGAGVIRAAADALRRLSNVAQPSSNESRNEAAMAQHAAKVIKMPIRVQRK